MRRFRKGGYVKLGQQSGGQIAGVMSCPVAARQQDELFCPNCGLRWPSDEERPQCLKGN